MNEAQQLLEYFIKNEGPWALLFVFLFVTVIRSNRERERNHRTDVERMEKAYSQKLEQIHQDTQLMVQTWKIIIERELERRETKNGTRYNSSKRGGDSTRNRSNSTGNKDDNTR